jgi:hypothetical protein
MLLLLLFIIITITTTTIIIIIIIVVVVIYVDDFVCYYCYNSLSLICYYEFECSNYSFIYILFNQIGTPSTSERNGWLGREGSPRSSHAGLHDWCCRA